MRTTFKDQYYHSYSRGIDKRDIFLDHDDYLRFMALINICNKKDSKSLSKLLKKHSLEELSKYRQDKKDLVKIDMYTVMPNHFHIEAQEKETNNLGRLKQRVLNAYTKYFNKKYSRQGHLFESKYKSKRIENGLYLSVLRDYIRKNPLKLLDNTYKHIDLLNGKRKITDKEKVFLKNYPYKYDATSDVTFG